MALNQNSSESKKNTNPVNEDTSCVSKSWTAIGSDDVIEENNSDGASDEDAFEMPPPMAFQKGSFSSSFVHRMLVLDRPRSLSPIQTISDEDVSGSCLNSDKLAVRRQKPPLLSSNMSRSMPDLRSNSRLVHNKSDGSLLSEGCCQHAATARMVSVSIFDKLLNGS